MKKWVCKKCGSTDVDGKIWTSLKKDRLNSVPVIVISDSKVLSLDDDDTYCHQCTSGGWGVEHKEFSDENLFES